MMRVGPPPVTDRSRWTCAVRCASPSPRSCLLPERRHQQDNGAANLDDPREPPLPTIESRAHAVRRPLDFDKVVAKYAVQVLPRDAAIESGIAFVEHCVD